MYGFSTGIALSIVRFEQYSRARTRVYTQAGGQVLFTIFNIEPAQIRIKKKNPIGGNSTILHLLYNIVLGTPPPPRLWDKLHNAQARIKYIISFTGCGRAD